MSQEIAVLDFPTRDSDFPTGVRALRPGDPDAFQLAPPLTNHFAALDLDVDLDLDLDPFPINSLDGSKH
jgi:hypothetical protein